MTEQIDYALQERNFVSGISLGVDKIQMRERVVFVNCPQNLDEQIGTIKAINSCGNEKQ